MSLYSIPGTPAAPRQAFQVQGATGAWNAKPILCTGRAPYESRAENIIIVIFNSLLRLGAPIAQSIIRMTVSQRKSIIVTLLEQSNLCHNLLESKN